jgi:hypothetical protein
VLFGLACVALFFPSRALVSPAYLGLGLFLLYLGWSMMQIPYLAWSGEISADYHGRTRVATYQQVAGSFALLMVLVLPTIIDQLRPGDSGLRLAAMGAAVLVSLVIALPLTLRAFPEQAPARHRPARHRSAASPWPHAEPDRPREAAAPRPALGFRGHGGAGHARRIDRLLRHLLHGPAAMGERPLSAAVHLRCRGRPRLGADRLSLRQASRRHRR